MNRKDYLMFIPILLFLSSLFFNLKPYLTTKPTIVCSRNHTFQYCFNDSLFMFNPTFMHIDELCQIKQLLESKRSESNYRVNTTHFSALHHYGTYYNCRIEDTIPKYPVDCDRMHALVTQLCNKVSIKIH